MDWFLYYRILRHKRIKNVKNTHGEELLLVKLQTIFTKRLHQPVIFTLFKFKKSYYQIVQSVSYTACIYTDTSFRNPWERLNISLYPCCAESYYALPIYSRSLSGTYYEWKITPHSFILFLPKLPHPFNHKKYTHYHQKTDSSTIHYKVNQV